MSTEAEPLGDARVVVTRALPGRLDARLGRLGAHVVHAPAIAFVDPDDDGRALRTAVGALRDGRYDWLVVSSATAVERLAAVAGDLARLVPVHLAPLRLAAIGPATAAAVASAGGTVDLLAPRAVGEALVEAFPTGAGRVLQLRPEVARDVIADGLRAKGWIVDEVAAYRTVAPELDAETRADVRGADVVTFTSPSTVQHLVAAVGIDGLPSLAVSIGPVTSAALRDVGIAVSAEADPHTVDGLVAAVVRAMGR
ncbi:MAG TPA: uroporphyrinogen-III synthase [Acidimicrobiales bacterium]|nr:uroporphyrinogen-III synthase [Acidimicrobiales bacterium]